MPEHVRRKTTRLNGTARDECYQAIRNCVKESLTEFYRAHPEWALDERAAVGIKQMLRMLKCILEILDRYKFEEDQS